MEAYEIRQVIISIGLGRCEGMVGRRKEGRKEAGKKGRKEMCNSQGEQSTDRENISFLTLIC